MAFWRNYGHLIWGTKNREPLIYRSFEPDLYAYLVSKAAELECFVHAINGVSDHVHLVVSIPPKHGVAWVVKSLKGASAHFVNHTIRPPDLYFAWQRGYGYLSLGETQLPRAVAYVDAQKERHALQQVNAWMEKTAELDEGPESPGDPLIGGSSRLNLREDTVLYALEEGMPF